MKKNNRTLISALTKIGFGLLVLTPVTFFVVVTFFGDLLCRSNSAIQSCGYAGAGLGVYALYAAAMPFVLGLVALLTSYFLNKK